MPMIAGMTGNTGTQSLAVVVRGLVSEDLNYKQVIKLIVRRTMGRYYYRCDLWNINIRHRLCMAREFHVGINCRQFLY